MYEQLPLFEGLAPELATFRLAGAKGATRAAHRIGEHVYFVVEGKVSGVSHALDKDGVLIRQQTVEVEVIRAVRGARVQHLLDESEAEQDGQTNIGQFGAKPLEAVR